MSYSVYLVSCAVSGKQYVGYTSRSVEARFAEHLNNAKWGRATALYAAIRKHGAEAFACVLLVECADHAAACEAEKQYISELKTVSPSGYNLTSGGDGVPMAPHVREQASAKMRGRCTPKQRAAADRRKGSRASDETRAKLSAVRKGRKQSPESVRKRVESFRQNRAAKLGLPHERAPAKEERRPRVWTQAEREAERARALAQWTPEARERARERALAQWDDKARAAARERALARYAKRGGEQL
jgi:group I intron endonuclease